MVVDVVKCEISKEQANQLISEDESPTNVRDFLSGPVVALLLKRENAYSHFQLIKNDIDGTFFLRIKLARFVVG